MKGFRTEKDPLGDKQVPDDALYGVQTVRAVVKGATKRIRVCTRCLRSGKITKAA